jgi:hypothetical protein
MEEESVTLYGLDAAMARFNQIARLKKNVEENKLCNRNDVQTLRKKIAILNQELIYSKQDMEQTKEAYQAAQTIHDKKTEQHKQFVEHLSIISKNHKETQEKQLKQLMAAMTPNIQEHSLPGQAQIQAHVAEPV